MTLMGRTLRRLQMLAVLLVALNVALGYGVAAGYVSIVWHIPWGFFSSLVIAFAHTMTIFYFAGMGVSMREAAAGRRWCDPYLKTGSRLRKDLALPLGLALVSLMAAVILGGGSHTRVLPNWPHHTAALAALCSNLFASRRSLASIRANEALIRDLQQALTVRTGHGGATAGDLEEAAARGRGATVAVDRTAAGR